MKDKLEKNLRPGQKKNLKDRSTEMREREKKYKHRMKQKQNHAYRQKEASRGNQRHRMRN